MSIVDIYMKSDLQVTRLSRCLYYEITYYDTNLHVLVEKRARLDVCQLQETKI